MKNGNELDLKDSRFVLGMSELDIKYITTLGNQMAWKR